MEAACMFGRPTLDGRMEILEGRRMTLTPDTLAQLSPPDRLARLQAEALAHYGTGRNQTAMARDFGPGPHHRATTGGTTSPSASLPP
jgi:hypothetical protein